MNKPLIVAALWLAGGTPGHAWQAPDESTLLPPASIQAEGVPPIPTSLAESLNRYQNIRSASFADWAPFWDVGVNKNQRDTGSMLITTRFGETSQVHRVAFPMGDRYQLTFQPERVVGALARPKHSEFVFGTDQGGGENFQFLLQGFESGVATRVTDGRSRHMGPKWSPSGKLLAYSSNARNGKDMDLYVLDPDKPGSARLFKQVEGTWLVSDWSRDETKVVAVEAISINESYVHIIEIESGKTETLTPRRARPADEPVSYTNVKWSNDGESLFWVTDKDSEFRRLVKYDLQTKEETVFTQDISWDVEDYDFSDDGEWLVLSVNKGGLSELHMFKPATGEEFPDRIGSLNLAKRIVSGIKFRPGSCEWAYNETSFWSPSDVHSEAFSKRPAYQWTNSEIAGFSRKSFAAPELISYMSFDGREIPAFVYMPSTERFPGKRPVVINIHGGPEGQFRPGFLGRANYLINELGIALIFPNVRGSSGYGKTYVKLDNGMRREDAVKDIGALLDWIATRGDFDATRVGVIGGSYGGFMSLAVQTTYNKRIKCGVDIVGTSNFVTFLKNTQDYRRDLRRVEYGDERDPEMRAFLERISPLNHADKIKTPILVVQGQNDPRTPISEAEQIVSAVRRNAVPVWYLVGKNEGHGFARKQNQDYLQAVEVLFWQRFLLNE